MSSKVRQSGFTAVELTVGMLAGAILAVTVGAMLVYGYSGWRACQRDAELQRDGAVVERLLNWELREAIRGRVVVTNGSQVVFQDADLAWHTVQGSGTALSYDGKTWISTLAGFSVTNSQRALAITLLLSNGQRQDEIRSHVFPRN